MNSKTLISVLLLVSTLAHAQQTGGGATGGGTAGGAAGGTAPGQTTPGQTTPGQTTPRQATPQNPGTQTPTGTRAVNPQNQVNQIPTTIVTNASGLPVAVDTNQFQAGLSNAIIPQVAATNQLFATNNLVFATNTLSISNGFILQDSAVTPADRSLLIQIRETVQPQLRAAGPWSPVSFVVRSAVVTLAGFVPSVQIRMQVESATRMVPGVLGVVNSLRVVTQDEAVSPSDRAVLLQIRQAIQPLQVSLGTAPLHFVVRNGNVTLVGLVPTPVLRQQIETSVSQVPGVVAIVNRSTEGAMTVSAPSSQSSTSAPSASGVTIVPPSPALVPAASGAVATNQFGTGPGTTPPAAPLTPTGRQPGQPAVPAPVQPPAAVPAAPPANPVPNTTTNRP